MKIFEGSWRLIIIVLLSLVVSGCFTMGLKGHYASSVIEYLYPEQQGHVEHPEVPLLSLPLDVGVAFVPDGSGDSRGQSLSEKDKLDLMDRVSAEFKKYPFVKRIEIIPSAYLRPKGSFGNLDQVRTMYGVDVIALLSYDQVQHTDEGILSLSYWTLIGAYIVEGEKNDTNTMIDAAVFHIPSRKMLFRAPGTSQVAGRATIVNLSEELRVDSKKGFTLAAENLVTNLDEQLAQFKNKMKESPEEYRIEHKPGYTGAGSYERAFAMVLLGLIVLAWNASRKSSG